MRLSMTCLSVLLVGSLAVTAPAWAEGTGNASGTAASGKLAQSPGAGAVRGNPLVLGWNYRYCAGVGVGAYGSGLIVKVVNTDGTWVTAASSSTALNGYQQMLLRACRQSNAYWGWNITNTATNSWNAASGF